MAGADRIGREIELLRARLKSSRQASRMRDLRLTRRIKRRSAIDFTKMSQVSSVRVSGEVISQPHCFYAWLASTTFCAIIATYFLPDLRCRAPCRKRGRRSDPDSTRCRQGQTEQHPQRRSLVQVRVQVLNQISRRKFL